MTKSLFFSFLLIALTIRCSNKSGKSDYPEQVGDIAFDKNLDDSTFAVCRENQIFQYYNFGTGVMYKGEKPAIEKMFFDTIFNESEFGYLTVRFIVNCNGKTGRYRIQQMDTSYQQKKFDQKSVDELVDRVKRLDGWMVGQDDRGNTYDYYQYLTFKIEYGRISEILP